jgi:hypothetical protein
MGTDHPPRDKQAHEPTDESLSLLENALREDDPSLGGGEHTEDVYSLFEEDALPPLACHASVAPTIFPHESTALAYGDDL